MTTDSLQTSIAAAALMADAAGTEILRYFRQPTEISNKLDDGDFDPVTEADRHAELAIRRIIEQQFPDDGIVGEEFGVRPSRNDRRWILDPIDGTRAFIAGLPVWGTLIALQQAGETVLGVLDQAYNRERWIGHGQHTTFHRAGQSRVVSSRACVDLADATLMTTSPDILVGDEHAAFYELSSQVRMTRYGCDCYAYAMVASGHVDVVVESGLNSYDIQALIPIIEGAGGVVTDWSGKPIGGGGGRVVAAGDRRCHEKVLKVLDA